MTTAPATMRAERLAHLVDLAVRGDLDAFGQLFDHFRAPVFRQLYALTRSTALAEDLTSETFLRALRAMPKFSLASHLFGPWLRTIARNLAMDHFNASRTQLELPTSDMTYHWDAAGGLQDIATTVSTSEALRQALDQLPTNQRRAIELRLLLQRSVTETALILGCNEGAARQLQWRAMRNLKRLLIEAERGDELGDEQLA